jgi:4-amino-4-deoxy-L-arabinose transferase-like glycosyltransferase
MSAPTAGRAAVDWHARLIVMFIAVGIGLRLVRYALRFPLWNDEALLAANFLDRGFADLMRPLAYHQVAPLGFLWAELAAVKLLGFNEWSLRLVPMLGGIASIFLFHRLARHVVRGTALVLTMGIFAANYSSVRYACEVKPYGVDLAVSTLLLLLTVRWWKRPEQTKWLWALAAAMPLALGLSFPAVFVAGGASVAIAAVLCRTLSRRGWAVWGILNLAIAASFLTWYWLAISAQAHAESGVMVAGWSEAFPPHSSILKLAVWFVKVHAGPLLAVPIGGDNWGSTSTLLLCIVAVVVLVRQAQYRLLVLCAAPFALNLLAAALRLYPYGGHMRLSMHVVPIVCLLAGIGAAAALSPLSHRERARVRAVDESVMRRILIAVALLLGLATGISARDIYLPGKKEQDIRKRDFAMWFWNSMERDHEVVCLLNGLPPALPPLSALGQGRPSPQFQCNERIYSPRRSNGKLFDLTRVSRDRPLACVQYWSHLAPYKPAIFSHWLDEMRQRYDLVATSRYPLLQDNDNDRQPEPADHVEVYEFVPKR